MSAEIRPFSAPNYFDNEEHCTKDSSPCVLCGKPIVDVSSAPSAVVVDGGARFVLAGETPDVSDSGFMGAFYVGPACARKLRRANVALT